MRPQAKGECEQGNRSQSQQEAPLPVKDCLQACSMKMLFEPLRNLDVQGFTTSSVLASPRPCSLRLYIPSANGAGTKYWPALVARTR
jgi:hypothetical protein